MLIQNIYILGNILIEFDPNSLEFEESEIE